MLIQSESTGSPTQNAGSSDVNALWDRYFATRALDDRNRLVLFYAPLVRLVASRVANRMHSIQSVEELCSCGQFGLIDAIERFDNSQGFQFATYATTRIQGAIIDELRRDDFLPKRMRARVRTYRVARESLESDLRRTPSAQEIADYLGATLPEVIELADLATTSSYLVPLSMDGEGSARLLASPRREPSEGVESSLLREEVKAALLRLTERQRQVLVLHYLEGFQKSEVADILGVDRSRVTQLIHQGLYNLGVELRDLQF